MGSESMTLRNADERALAYVEALLEANDLPTQDVQSKPECFYVGVDGNDRVGAGGIERLGSDGLLRSVVVDRSERGMEYGTAICDALESRARADGIERLYLLTTTARAFFADRGYTVIDRDDPPDEIRQTAEFSEFCPASATCMRKSL